MKRVNNIYNKINDVDVIMKMYDKVKKSTKNKRKISNFDDYYSENIINIRNIINSKNYIPSKYNIFFIREPKVRIIMSQNIKDKIINHLVAKYFLIDIFDRKLIKENTATREKKGTHYALNLFKKYINYYKNKYDDFYILKFDISKYFYNIDHSIVKDIIKHEIKDKEVLKIINRIVDSTDLSYVNNSISYFKKKEIDRLNKLDIIDKAIKIKEIEELPLYKKGKGLPIGNMTSQIIATFYLNSLDHYIKENLGIKHYIRYMDDGVLIFHNKGYLDYCLKEIEKKLKELKLSLNKKSKIYRSNEEIEFLGFRFLIKNRLIMKISNKTKKRFKRRLNINNLPSYIGHLSNGNCHELIRIEVGKLLKNN